MEMHALMLNTIPDFCRISVTAYRRRGAAVWAYCLMPSPHSATREEALGRALGETHLRYSSVINARLRVTGHLFQSRFGSVVMDEEHLMAAAR